MTASLLILLSVISGPPSSAANPSQATTAVLANCPVSICEEVQIPARETGQLVQVFIKENEVVAANQAVAQIDDEQARLDKTAAELQRAAAMEKANDNSEIQLAQANYQLAEAELAQAQDVNVDSPGAVPLSEVRRLSLARHRASLQIENSRMNQRVAKMEAKVNDAAVQSATSAISRRKITSNVSGLVKELYRHAGEWVNAGDPVAHVIRMDKLRVEGLLSARQYRVADVVDKPVLIEVEMENGRRERFAGKVVMVKPDLKSKSEYVVRAEVQNRQEGGHWMLRPGFVAYMVIKLR